MTHEHSILYGPINKLLALLLGPPSNAPSWWRDGVTIGGFHVAGGAPMEEGTAVAWLPDHVCMALLVFVICAVLFPLMARAYKRGAPEPAQNVLEVFVDFLRGVAKENIEHHADKYLPIVGAFFFFIFIANSFGWFFFLSPPTSNLNTTFALSISCFLFFNATGIKEHGLLGYLKHFLGPVLALAPLLFVIEMIGNFARALSLAMRLFGNIFGEHMANSIFSGLVPIVVPWPMQALGILAALLQAYVFALLCSVYIGGATAHESH
ncbi:MAG TPA: F0F1 ATP synthase subunit A [Thermoanaerobaculia bacterium]|nr:F0F1 ATP synthase subunit A [Thermoanaerobaculia bacterium]